MKSYSILKDEFNLDYDKLPENVRNEIYITEQELERELSPETDSITEKITSAMEKKSLHCKKIFEIFDYPLIIATGTGLAYTWNKIEEGQARLLAGYAISYYEKTIKENAFRRLTGESPENLWIKRFDYNKETFYAITYKENYNPLLNHVIMILLMILDSHLPSSLNRNIQIDFILRDNIERILEDYGLLKNENLE